MSNNKILFPFGTPDGRPSDDGTPSSDPSDDPLADFVTFEGRWFRRGLGMDPNDKTVRVLVGRKGAGKTLYLRRLQSYAQRDASLYADQWRIDHPPTEYIIEVFDACQSATAASALWERIWHCAILRSVVTHLLYAPHLREAADPSEERDLRELVGRVYPTHEARTSPYQEVQNLLHDHRPNADLNSYLGMPVWHTLEERVRSLLQYRPPVFFYLDALDDHFEQAPAQWLACQKGLCLRVLKMATKIPRLHVVITVRDLVYSAVLASEHLTRNEDSERLRMLDWNARAIDRLLHHKIDQLPDEYLLQPDAEDPLERWLGITHIANSGEDTVRGAENELLKDYLLRHTRLIPRDVVRLGNALCALVDLAYDTGSSEVSSKKLHVAVRGRARKSGREELLIVANHITTAAMPKYSAKWGIHGSFSLDASDMDDHEYVSGDGDEGQTWQHFVRSRMLTSIRKIGEDRITAETLKELVDDVRPFVGDADVVSILWKHGLLGYVEGSRTAGDTVFYSPMDDSELHLLPDDHDAFVFHPIIIDAVGPPMRGVGDPVVPF